MSKIKTFLAALLLAPATAFAGGFLTNTNQSVAFLRNPARDAIIAVDGVYYNPAGLVFMPKGFHIGLNIQSAYQNRDVTTTLPGFAYGLDNNGSTKKFHGSATAPFIPSLQVVHKFHDKWALSFNFAVTGGGGKCEYEDGLASFESAVTLLKHLDQNAAIGGYKLDSYMKGRQYYYGFQIGASYKINDNLGVFVGGRLIYANCNYYGYVKNIQLEVNGTLTPAAKYAAGQYASALQIVLENKKLAEEAAGAGDYAKAVEYGKTAAVAQQTAAYFGTVATATQDITLNCDQQGWGFTPVIGIDWKFNKFNIAAKYEFRTKMSLKNTAANSESAASMAMLAPYMDGGRVRSDIPGTLTVGVQYEPIPSLRVSAGFHWYDDKNAKQTYTETKQYYDDRKNLIEEVNVRNDKNKMLSSNTYEILAGAEYDINKWLQVSAGWQTTQYGLTDAYMSDISFVTSSNSIGLGFGIKVKKNIKLNVSYFQTFYNRYDRKSKDYNNLSKSVEKIAYNIYKNGAYGSQDPDVLAACGGDEKLADNVYAAQVAAKYVSNASPALSGSDSFKRTNIVFGIGAEISF